MFFHSFKGWLRRRKSDERVIEQYLKHGASFGDAVSYIYMGECIGFEKLLEAWAVWERDFAERGYRTLSVDAFVDLGGYGKKPEPFPVRREPGEEPVLHAEIYRQRYLGKIAPTFDFNVLKAGEIQTGTYVIPSTEDAKKASKKP